MQEWYLGWEKVSSLLSQGYGNCNGNSPCYKINTDKNWHKHTGFIHPAKEHCKKFIQRRDKKCSQPHHITDIRISSSFYQ